MMDAITKARAANAKSIRAEIADLKKRAKDARLTMLSAGDMSCGWELACQFRPYLATAEAEFNRCIARLREIDPTCPGYTGMPHEAKEG